MRLLWNTVPKFAALLLAMFLVVFDVDAQPSLTIDVGPGDVVGLVSAIEAATAANGAIINLAPGSTYTFIAPYPASPLNALPPIETPIVINGNGATITRDVTAANFRFFFVAPTGGLTLGGLTLSNGRILAPAGANAQGGAIRNEGNLYIGDVTFAANSVEVASQEVNTTLELTAGDGQGGAIFNANSGTISEIRNADFALNSAFGSDMILGIQGGDGQGGAIYNAGRLNRIVETQFQDNRVESGRGYVFVAVSPEAQGGALHNASSGIIDSIEGNTTFTRNSALGRFGTFATNAVGGALWNGGIITRVDSSRFSENVVKSKDLELPALFTGEFSATANLGRAIADRLDRLIPFFPEEIRATIQSLSGLVGGICSVVDCSNVLVLGRGSLGGNHQGGAIFNQGQIGITGSRFNQNEALGAYGLLLLGGTGSGGAIHNSTMGTITTLSFSEFANNVAEGGIGASKGGSARGGAIFSGGSMLEITGSIFVQNAARGSLGFPAPDTFIDLFPEEERQNLFPFIPSFARVSGGDADGGALFVASSSQITIRNSSFTQNVTESGYGGTNSGQSRGGAIFSGSSTSMIIIGAVVQANQSRGRIGLLVANNASQGGGIYNDTGAMTITDAEIVENSAIGAVGALGIKQGLGGGLYNNSGFVQITGSTISRNVADGGAGAIGGTGEGGGIHNFVGRLVLVDSLVTSNTARGGAGLIGGGAYGGGIFNGGFRTLTGPAVRGTISIIGSQVSENLARGQRANVSSGGGLYNTGTLSIVESNVTLNSAIVITCAGYGGGLANELGASSRIENSSFANNSIAFDDSIDPEDPNLCEIQRGGAIFNGRLRAAPVTLLEGISSLNLINTTISNNETPGSGGGIFNEHDAQLNFVTLAENTASSGGGIFTNGETTAVNNSILASNTAGNCTAAGGRLVGYGVNIVTDETCASGGANFRFIPPTALLLGPLANNAPGLTLTHALQPGSPAIGAVTDCTTITGASVTVDQRGVSRTASLPCDVGAFEVEGISGASGQFVVFDPAISKLGFLLPGSTGIAGEQIRWVVTVRNNSVTAISNVIITDTLNSDLLIDRVETSSGTSNISGQTVSVNIPQMQPDESVIVDIFTTALQGIAEDLTNTACVTAANTDVERCASSFVVRQLPNTGETPWYLGWIRILFVLAGCAIAITALVRIARKREISKNAAH
ncbi:MAG: choice-of-anchor Q domain-containing protein [Chloroflexota bacterium]|nr:choice-of-anchor Q domain-containing protein [Chloroflexota bacterium]